MEQMNREYAEAKMKAIDEACKKAIIGSKILDLKMEPVKRTKHMYLLTIITDAPSVQEGNVVHCCNELQVKVKMR